MNLARSGSMRHTITHPRTHQKHLTIYLGFQTNLHLRDFYDPKKWTQPEAVLFKDREKFAFFDRG